MNNRDNFHKPTVEALGKRVSYQCSNPTCGRSTIGPHSNTSKVTLMGVAAHITAASSGGPRYDSSLSKDERQDIDNGIWLCVNCSTIIDKDPNSYSVQLLNSWKKEAEDKALKNLNGEEGTSNSKRPVLEIDLIYRHSGRSPRGYAPENFKDGKPLQAGGRHIQFWDLNWNCKIVIMNNSSEPAFNLVIEQIEGRNKPRISGISKLNNIPPFKSIEASFIYEQFIKGTHLEADLLINQTIPTSIHDVKYKLTYKNESRQSFETIVVFENGEVENII